MGLYTMMWHWAWKRGSNGNWSQISSSFTEVPPTLLEKWWSCTCLQFDCSHGTTACHVIVTWPFFPSKSSLLCRSWHVSNPAETKLEVLFRLFILCANREIMYFRITLKKSIWMRRTPENRQYECWCLFHHCLHGNEAGINATSKRVKSLK